MIDYENFPGLAGVYLEDSYVLGIVESPGQLTFRLDAVLTPEHPAYRPRRAGEQYCYAQGTLHFDGIERVEWLGRNDGRYTDASGDTDLGNIDVLTIEGDSVIADGDWGRVRILRGRPRFEVDQRRGDS